jgi:dipeptidyl-peptidase 4
MTGGCGRLPAEQGTGGRRCWRDSLRAHLRTHWRLRAGGVGAAMAVAAWLGPLQPAAGLDAQQGSAVQQAPQAQGPGTAGRASAELQTAGEASGFARHTRHDEMMAYLSDLGARAPDLVVGSYGETVEGRALPWLLFSRPRVTSPAEAHASGKPVLLLGANVHGFNHVVREALLLLARDLGTPGTELNALLDDLIVLMVPSKNPDGLEADIRFNARGADLNRDYMALLEPESLALVGELLNRWNPHLTVDGHDGGDVQYGGAYPYHILLQGPGLAGADPALSDLVDLAILPWVFDGLEQAGLRGFYWSRGNADAWIVGGTTPRMGRNYGGLSGKVTLLFEVNGWTGFAGGVPVAQEALRGVLTWAAQHPQELVRTVQASRARTAQWPPMGDFTRIPVAERMEAGPLRPTWLLPDPASDRAGEFMVVTDGIFEYRAVGTAFRGRPWAWVIPPEAEALVALLDRHGIAVERLTHSAMVEATGYALGPVTLEPGANLIRSAPRVTVAGEVTVVREIPAGSWIVQSAQPLGRVAAHLLEVETADSATWWGFLTPFLPPPAAGGAGGEASAGGGAASAPSAAEALFPILKLMDVQPLSRVAR